MTPLAAGARLGRYEIRSKLGAGGMAEVYLAIDTELGRLVALKLLPAETSADPHAQKRLLREARAAATLDHPNICAVHEVGEADGHHFIAMQHVEGETLDARLKRAPLELDQALAIAADVADALADAHAHGIVHRDIKPSNVMITTRGQTVVLDFGLAKVTDVVPPGAELPTESLLSAPGTVLGTVPYMSPEQVRGEALDGRSDIFSLGAMLYEMVSGQRPFADTSAAAIASAILTRETRPLARFTPDVPAELERIVTKALRKDPGERYQTARDLSIDLRALRTDREFKRRLDQSADRAPSTSAPAAPAPAVPPVGGRSVSWRRPAFLAGVVVLASVAGLYVRQQSRVRWARSELPRIEQLAMARNYFDAFDLAVEVEPYLSGDPTLERLLRTVAMTVSATTAPAGADVYLKRFRPDASGVLPPRVKVGTTPLDLRVARGEYVLAMERDGYAPTEQTISGVLLRSGDFIVTPPPVRVDQVLVARAAMPEGMVRVPAGEYRLVGWSRPTDVRVHLDDYFIDKYEVTNAQFKEFISAGGYLKPEFWRHPFVRDGRVLGWEEAVRMFTDRTGLQGPRSWSNQNVPDGKADHPVTDITWYEASAYAAFRGKQLPTVFQWEKAARNGATMALVNYMPWGAFYPGDTLAHHANFESDGTRPVGSAEFGMSPFGAYDMAGNVAEWTATPTSQGHLATGGAWGDPTYVFGQYPMLPAFYTSPKLGFRCARTAPGATGDQGAARIDVTEEIPQYRASSRADFETWAARYRHDGTPLEPRVEERLETAEWTRERISFNGAGGERAFAYLYLPKNFTRPLSVLHFVPGGDVENGFRPLSASMEDRVGSFIKSGRAAFGVVLRGYTERLRPTDQPNTAPSTVEYLETIVNRVVDLRRGLDYLATRQDIDAGRIAFVGPSAGAQIGLILAAVETRYRAVVLIGAGLPKRYATWIDEANPVNFAAHIAGPTIMIHGRYDEDTPLRTAAEPLFRLLRQPKELVLYEGGHVPSNEFLIPVLGRWLDEKIGPVRR